MDTFRYVEMEENPYLREAKQNMREGRRSYNSNQENTARMYREAVRNRPPPNKRGEGRASILGQAQDSVATLSEEARNSNKSGPAQEEALALLKILRVTEDPMRPKVVAMLTGDDHPGALFERLEHKYKMDDLIVMTAITRDHHTVDLIPSEFWTHPEKIEKLVKGAATLSPVTNEGIISRFMRFAPKSLLDNGQFMFGLFVSNPHMDSLLNTSIVLKSDPRVARILIERGNDTSLSKILDGVFDARFVAEMYKTYPERRKKIDMRVRQQERNARRRKALHK